MFKHTKQLLPRCSFFLTLGMADISCVAVTRKVYKVLQGGFVKIA